MHKTTFLEGRARIFLSASVTVPPNIAGRNLPPEIQIKELIAFGDYMLEDAPLRR